MASSLLLFVVKRAQNEPHALPKGAWVFAWCDALYTLISGGLKQSAADMDSCIAPFGAVCKPDSLQEQLYRARGGM
jgi:hypothetical protein